MIALSNEIVNQKGRELPCADFCVILIKRCIDKREEYSMTDYMKAITYGFPEKIPVKVAFLPATWAKYGKELQALCLRLSSVFMLPLRPH
jgi:hypothetical protein